MAHGPPGSSVHGDSEDLSCHVQARILEWVAVPSSRGHPNPGVKPTSFLSPALASRFFTTSATWEAPYVYAAAAAKSLHSCLALCDPIDSSLPGSPIPGILQARTLEWVAISFSNA